MGRLFWKFFLTFWLAVSMAGLAVGIVVWLYRPAQSAANSAVAMGPPPEQLVRIGESVLNSAGLEALRNMMRDLQDGDPFPLYAVDANGHELLGRTVDAGLLAEARRFADRDEPHSPVRRVRLAGGATYLLFVPATHPPAGIHPFPQSGPPAPPGPPPNRPPPWLPILAGVLASIMFSALLAWYMAKPVRHLRHAFHAAAAGDLDTRIEPLMGRRRDEIADLGREYDRMAGRLKALIDAQRRLFHDVSHELRSPLARLQAAIGLARQDPRQTDLSMQRIERESAKLDTLVGELLTLARLESGVPQAREDEIELFQLVEATLEDARFEAEAMQVRVKFLGEGFAIRSGQEPLLGQAMENIIRNAIKYTPAGGVVTVEAAVEVQSRCFHLVVSDEGPGVAEDELQSILEPFFRGRGKHLRDGYGLGLAIARRAVEAHGGTITVSNIPRGGLRVDIRLTLDN